MCFLENSATEQALLELDEPDLWTEKPRTLALFLMNLFASSHFVGFKSRRNDRRSIG